MFVCVCVLMCGCVHACYDCESFVCQRTSVCSCVHVLVCESVNGDKEKERVRANGEECIHVHWIWIKSVILKVTKKGFVFACELL